VAIRAALRLAALAFALTACHGVILICGWLRLATLIGPAQAFAAGVVPFWAGALGKSLLAAALTWPIRQLRHRQALGVASGGNSPG